MLYDFTLTQGDDRGSIKLIRTYESPKRLTKKQLAGINKVIEQAIEASGAASEGEEVFLAFDKAWVATASGERIEMLLSDYPVIESTGKLNSTNPHDVASQILNEFASSEDWSYYFDGDASTFRTMDFGAFELIDSTVDNTNLKYSIGTPVYVRGGGDYVYAYQGNPTNESIKIGYDPYILGSDIYATESHIIAVDDVKVADFAGVMEAFPLPMNYSRENFFAREKSTKRTRKEAFGKTQKEAKLRLAIMLAFDKITVAL